MLRTLLESRRSRTRDAGRLAMSIGLHGGLVLSFMLAAAEAAPAPEPRAPETIVFQQTAPPREKPTAIEPSAPTAPVAPADIIPVVSAPIMVPSVLPLLDLAAVAPASVQFALNVGNRSVANVGATATTQATAGDGVFMEHQVERPARVEGSASAPVYPDALRRAGVEGDVLVSFVVDTLGRADMGTFTVLRSTHDLFARAVRHAVSAQRFGPAETGGRRVRQLVQQPFAFSIRR